MGEAALGLRERKKQRTRATLIDAAVELCKRQGYERTTVDQIAAIADVSPRTFSRYFATKDAVVMAFVDEVVGAVAIELARQPSDISHLDAIYQAHVAAFGGTKSAPAHGLTEERLLATSRIVTSSPSLLHTTAEFRPDAVNAALSVRMGVAYDAAELKLVAAVWGSILLTAFSDLGGDTDWGTMTVDALVSRLMAVYAQFVDVAKGVGKSV
jgi:AcrR family transcriptional regulator